MSKKKESASSVSSVCSAMSSSMFVCTSTVLVPYAVVITILLEIVSEVCQHTQKRFGFEVRCVVGMNQRTKKFLILGPGQIDQIFPYESKLLHGAQKMCRNCSTSTAQYSLHVGVGCTQVTITTINY